MNNFLGEYRLSFPAWPLSNFNEQKKEGRRKKGTVLRQKNCEEEVGTRELFEICGKKSRNGRDIFWEINGIQDRPRIWPFEQYRFRWLEKEERHQKLEAMYMYTWSLQPCDQFPVKGSVCCPNSEATSQSNLARRMQDFMAFAPSYDLVQIEICVAPCHRY